MSEDAGTGMTETTAPDRDSDAAARADTKKAKKPDTSQMTPMMAQYWQIKRENP